MKIQNTVILNSSCKGLSYILYKLLREWEFYGGLLQTNRNKSRADHLLDKFYSYLFNTVGNAYNKAEVRVYSRGGCRHYIVILS